jgi:gliding motility-associated-like protein
MPNVFTPNTDSLNERFAPDTDCEPDEYLLQVYNRWGEMLFESFEYQNKWDGSYAGVPVPEGVYFWILLVSEKRDGISNRKPLSGTVTVLR